MIKQMISFTDPQRTFLIREAKRLGISIAELVRRIIDRHIDDTRMTHANMLDLTGQTFGRLTAIEPTPARRSHAATFPRISPESIEP